MKLLREFITCLIMVNKIVAITTIIFFGKLQNVFGVQITKLYVPIRASHEAPLDCRYDLESDQLYDVKWYKDGSQFFRCLPDGTTAEYPLEGIKILHSNKVHVGSCSLTLMMLNKKSSGDFKCEVSTEGPAFKTAMASSKLFIIQVEPRNKVESSSKGNKNGYYESHTTDIANQGINLKNNVILIISFVLLIKYINYI